MAKKKEMREKHPIFNYDSIILLVIFLAIPIAFFFLLAKNVPDKSFGLAEIGFSIAFSVLVASFLLWTRALSMKNAYLGAIIGLVALGAFEYSLFFKYKGPYTTTFSIITALVVIVYLGINLVIGLGKKKKDAEDYYEDNPTE